MVWFSALQSDRPVWKKPPVIVVLVNVEVPETTRVVTPRLVEVIEAPEAVVKFKVPLNVPPVNSR